MNETNFTYEQAVAYLAMLAMWLIPAGAGRGAWYASQLRAGRVPLTLGLVIGEAITAVLMAIVAGGLSNRLGLSPTETMAVIGLVSWLGPGGFFTAAAKVLRLDAPKEPK